MSWGRWGQAKAPEVGQGKGVRRPPPNLSFTAFTCLTSNKPFASPLLCWGADPSGILRQRPEGQEKDGPMRAAGNQGLGLLSGADYSLGSLILALCDLGPATPRLRDSVSSVAMEGGRPP